MPDESLYVLQTISAAYKAAETGHTNLSRRTDEESTRRRANGRRQKLLKPVIEGDGKTGRLTQLKNKELS